MPEAVRHLDLTVAKDRLEGNALCDEDSSSAYVEEDDTAYRIWHFEGPRPLLFKEFVGAIAEWQGKSKRPTIALYRSEEMFGKAFANITIIANQVE